MTQVSSAVPGSFMTKTPFVQSNNHSSSFEDDDEDEADLEDEANETTSNPPGDFEELDHPSRIRITKKVPQANAMPVVNKMSQHVYADHHNQAQYPPKGKCSVPKLNV